MSKKRNLFAELTEGMTALAEARGGKRTLRTHAVELKPVPAVTPRELLRLRETLNLSRAVFAGYLRTNVRTLENWEQGRAKPNAQAALLIKLVKRFPDTVERLAIILPTQFQQEGRRIFVPTLPGPAVAFAGHHGLNPCSRMNVSYYFLTLPSRALTAATPGMSR